MLYFFRYFDISQQKISYKDMNKGNIGSGISIFRYIFQFRMSTTRTLFISLLVCLCVYRLKYGQIIFLNPKSKQFNTNRKSERLPVSVQRPGGSGFMACIQPPRNGNQYQSHSLILLLKVTMSGQVVRNLFYTQIYNK